MELDMEFYLKFLGGLYNVITFQLTWIQMNLTYIPVNICLHVPFSVQWSSDISFRTLWKLQEGDILGYGYGYRYGAISEF